MNLEFSKIYLVILYQTVTIILLIIFADHLQFPNQNLYNLQETLFFTQISFFHIIKCFYYFSWKKLNILLPIGILVIQILIP